jgi:hypothetical protein
LPHFDFTKPKIFFHLIAIIEVTAANTKERKRQRASRASEGISRGRRDKSSATRIKYTKYIMMYSK